MRLRLWCYGCILCLTSKLADQGYSHIIIPFRKQTERKQKHRLSAWKTFSLLLQHNMVFVWITIFFIVFAQTACGDSTLKEVKMRDGNFLSANSFARKNLWLSSYKGWKHLHAGWGLFLFLSSSNELQELEYSRFASRISLELTKLAKLSLRSKLTTIETSAEEEVKTTARTIVVNFVNFDNFEQSDNFRKLSK